MMSQDDPRFRFSFDRQVNEQRFSGISFRGGNPIALPC